jgi:hypothetical protein
LKLILPPSLIRHAFVYTHFIPSSPGFESRGWHRSVHLT